MPIAARHDVMPSRITRPVVSPSELRQQATASVPRPRTGSRRTSSWPSSTKLPDPAIGLASERYLPTLVRLAACRITGGSIYDGLISATAHEHGLTLLTLDRRAGLARDAIGAQVRRPTA